MNGKNKSTNKKESQSSWPKRPYPAIAFWRHIIPAKWQRTLIKSWKENPPNLIEIMVGILVILLICGFLLWISLGWLLGNNWPFLLDRSGTTRFSVTQMTLLTLAGLVGGAGVVVTFRRQQGIEEGEFLERLANSARQLGDQNPSVQAAGAYALAGLADKSRPSRRQQCIDVLCSYLRLPYAPVSNSGQLGDNVNIEKIVQKFSQDYGERVVEEEHTISVRPHDKEIRHTIIRIIADHLKANSSTNWSEFDFDFTGTTFDGGSFNGSIFKGRALFIGATFTGAGFSFRKVDFMNANVSFAESRFTHGDVDFSNATFNGGKIDFSGAEFAGGTAKFQAVNFSSGTVNFDSNFLDGTTTFNGAYFTGATVVFEGAEFSGGTVTFNGAHFSSGVVTFNGAHFSGSAITFNAPKDWSTPPQVPWEKDAPPFIEPNQWPPLPRPAAHQ